MRPLHEGAKPFLALPEPLEPTDPAKKVADQVTDDREQGDVIL